MSTDQLPWQRFAALQLAQRHWQCLPEDIPVAEQSAFQAQLTRQMALELAICRHYPADNTVSQLAALVRKEQAGFMDTHGFTHDEQQAVAVHQAHVTSVMNRVARKAPPPDDQEVVAWYQANAARFCRPAQRKARHILLTCDNDEDRARNARKLLRLFWRLLNPLAALPTRRCAFPIAPAQWKVAYWAG